MKSPFSIYWLILIIKVCRQELQCRGGINRLHKVPGVERGFRLFIRLWNQAEIHLYLERPRFRKVLSLAPSQRNGFTVSKWGF